MQQGKRIGAMGRGGRSRASRTDLASGPAGSRSAVKPPRLRARFAPAGWTVATAALLLPWPALACTTCQSPVAREVRLRVMENFWTDLVGVLACLPFLVAAVVALSWEPPDSVR